LTPLNAGEIQRINKLVNAIASAEKGQNLAPLASKQIEAMQN